MYIEFLPVTATQGADFDSLRGCQSEEDKENSALSFDNSKQKNEDENYVEEEGDNNDKMADDEEVEDLKKILEMEANFGNSQPLFLPMHPDEF